METCQQFTARIETLKDEFIEVLNDYTAGHKKLMAIATLSGMRTGAKHEWMMKSQTMAKTRKACKHCDCDWEFWHK